jgi:hypothetical protein
MDLETWATNTYKIYPKLVDKSGEDTVEHLGYEEILGRVIAKIGKPDFL